MDNSIDSSPLKRLGTFLLGLLTFVAFGCLAWLVFKVSGGDSDPYYAQKSEERAAKIAVSREAQATELAPTDSDLTAFVAANKGSGPVASKRPVPGTNAFNEWMKKMAAAQPPKEEPPKQEPPKQEIIKLTLKAVGNPPGTMKFEAVDLSVKGGSKVSLTFTNPDILQHNFVLLKIGKKDAVGTLADAMLTDPEALKKHYLPTSEDIIASSKLVNPGASEVIEFTIPKEPGDYPYICTFPGHWRLMNGILKVTK